MIANDNNDSLPIVITKPSQLLVSAVDLMQAAVLVASNNGFTAGTTNWAAAMMAHLIRTSKTNQNS